MKSSKKIKIGFTSKKRAKSNHKAKSVFPLAKKVTTKDAESRQQKDNAHSTQPPITPTPEVSAQDPSFAVDANDAYYEMLAQQDAERDKAQEHAANSVADDESLPVPQFPQFTDEELEVLYGEEIDQLYQKEKDPKLRKRAKGPIVHVGLMCQYVPAHYNPKGKKQAHNHILSYHAYVHCEGRECTVNIYTENNKISKRYKSSQVLTQVIIQARKERVISTNPSSIVVYGYELIHLIQGFKNCQELLKGMRIAGNRIFQGRRTGRLFSEEESDAGDQGEKQKLQDKHRHSYETFVRYVDIADLIPNKMTLEEVTPLINIPLEALPEDFKPDQLNTFLTNDPETYERYATQATKAICHYGLFVQRFFKAELGRKGTPTTIASAAASYCKQILKAEINQQPELVSWEAVMGQEPPTTSTTYNPHSGRYISQSMIQPIPARKNHMSFISYCFHGGRNEGIYTGPTPKGDYYDLDLASAYSVALCDLYTLDYAQTRHTTNVEDYQGHVAGYAYVSFRFPKDVRFPCLPVRTKDNESLIFPLEGESYCTAPEIGLALSLGCSITIKQGVVIPWAQTQTHLFDPFVHKTRTERNEAKQRQDKLKEKMWKDIGNNLYGKLAQGVREDRQRRTQKTELTNECFAAHITGFVRAVIAEIMNQLPSDSLVVSVTTDGFLSNTTVEDCNVSGPLCRRYQAHCDRLNVGPMLVEKHRNSQTIGIKTRGQLTAEYCEGHESILAKAGVKLDLPDTTNMTAEEKKKAENEAMIDLYHNRTAKMPPHQNQIPITISKMIKDKIDLLITTRKASCNLEYDFKRKPVKQSMEKVRDSEHLTFNSQPWEHRNDYELTRKRFDQFRKTQCLKTLDDWEHWQEYFHHSQHNQASRSQRFSSQGMLDILKRTFLRAYTRSTWGINKDATYQQIATWLTNLGIKTSVNDLKNATKAKLEPQALMATEKILKTITALIAKYPALQLENFFQGEDLQKVKEHIKKNNS